MTRIHPILIAAAFAALPMGAFAGQGQLPPGCTLGDAPGQDATMACFEDLDTNGDGALSPEEAQVLPRLRGRFEAHDLDGDGLLSPVEFQGEEITPPQRGGAKNV
jgi:hypothetical protein